MGKQSAEKERDGGKNIGIAVWGDVDRVPDPDDSRDSGKIAEPRSDSLQKTRLVVEEREGQWSLFDLPSGRLIAQYDDDALEGQQIKLFGPTGRTVIDGEAAAATWEAISVNALWFKGEVLEFWT